MRSWSMIQLGMSHCIALSRPKELADRLDAYLIEQKEPIRWCAEKCPQGRARLGQPARE
jgi:hypothetical protein